MQKKLKDIPEKDRPREKLKSRGAEHLSDTELLAILLGSGTKGQDVMETADRLLKEIDGTKGHLRLADIQKTKGVGDAKAMVIAAALEFSRRRIRPEGFKIKFPADVVPLIQHYADRKQEHFLCISINGANEVIKTRIVSVGLVNRTHVHPREVFADPITDRASAVIIAHNHPDGDLNPSAEDLKITKTIKEASTVLGINLLDHIIFNTKGYYSFIENDKL